jgi:hypothetical protein
MLNKTRKAGKGFSIVEVITAAFLMAIAFVGLLQLHIYSLIISGKSKEFNTATRDAASMMEKIGTVDFSSVVAKFPNSCCVGSACGAAPVCPGASDIVVASEMILKNEKVVVSYPSGTGGDPLGISVTASWTGRDRRQHCNGCDAPPVVLSTIATKT